MRSRAVALLAGMALAGFTVFSSPWAAPAQADSTASEALLAAASWTVAQLSDGTHASDSFGPDYGLTADVALGLAATGAADTTTRAVAAWLAEHAQRYVDGGVPGDVSAGALAKLALVARTVGIDPSSFGGIDLDLTLRSRLQPSGRYTDSLTDVGPQPLDLSNVFTQGLAILALRDGAGAPAPAVDFLVGQRCAAGGFPVFYAQRPQDCLPDADGTGIAVQALLAVRRAADAEPAVAWLLGQQAPDGSFRNGGPGAVPNSNSTSLAAQALRVAGRTEAADAALTWLRSRQVGCAAPVGDRGAIGYAEPVADASALRATAEALPALAGISLADLDGLAGSKPDQLPAEPCSAASSPTTAGTPTTAATATPTTSSSQQAATVPTSASRSAAPAPAPVTDPATASPSSAPTPALTPIPAAAAAGSPQTTEAVPSAVQTPSDSPAAPQALAAGVTGDDGAPRALGVAWWVGAAAVLVAIGLWLWASGRLPGRSVKR